MSDAVSREPNRSRQYWTDHYLRWQESGLSKAAYCAKHTIKPASFYNWSSKIAKQPSTDPIILQSKKVDEPGIQFHPIKLTPDKPSGVQFVHIERAATEIALPASLPLEQIHCWLSAIHQLHV